jgi:MFS family permease
LLAFVTDFGWSRTATAAAFSIHMTFYALGGWALGVLVDRLGPRRVIAWSTGAWILTLLLCSVIQNLRRRVSRLTGSLGARRSRTTPWRCPNGRWGFRDKAFLGATGSCSGRTSSGG